MLAQQFLPLTECCTEAVSEYVETTPLVAPNADDGSFQRHDATPANDEDDRQQCNAHSMLANRLQAALGTQHSVLKTCECSGMFKLTVQRAVGADARLDSCWPVVWG